MLFLREGGERTVPGGDDGVLGEGEELFLVVAELVGEVGGAAAHGAGENRVAADGQRPAQAGEIEGRHARRMAPGEEGLDRKFAKVEVGVFLEALQTREIEGLRFADPDHGLGLGGQAREVGDVVLVGVGDENVGQLQLLGVERVEHGLAVRPGVERGGLAEARVPGEVAVHGHVLVGRVEHGEAARKIRLGRIPGLAGQFLEGIRPEPQVARHAPDDRDEGLAGLDGGQVGDADLGAVGEVFVGDLQAALRLADDVVEVVLDRNPGHERRVNAGAEEARKPNGGKITVGARLGRTRGAAVCCPPGD